MILFYHNTASAYRIPLFQAISRKCDVRFVFTRGELSEKVYGYAPGADAMRGMKAANLRGGAGAFLELYRQIAAPDVCLVMVPTLDSVIETVYAYWIFLLARLRGKRVTYLWGKWEAPREFQPLKKKMKNAVQRAVARPILRHVDFCFAYGRKARQYFIDNGVDARKVGIVLNVSEMPVLPEEDVRAASGIPRTAKVVLYFGRIIEKKGLDVLLRAFSELNDESAWLMIAGTGPFEGDCRALAEHLNLRRIAWIGFVHPDRRHAYFSQCDAFVLPTHFSGGSVEAWGLTVNEAMQCGKPVVATDAVGAAWDMIDEKNGRVARAGDAKSLAAALRAALLPALAESAAAEDRRLMGIYSYENSAELFVRQFCAPDAGAARTQAREE